MDFAVKIYTPFLINTGSHIIAFHLVFQVDQIVVPIFKLMKWVFWCVLSKDDLYLPPMILFSSLVLIGDLMIDMPFIIHPALSGLLSAILKWKVSLTKGEMFCAVSKKDLSGPLKT